MKIFKKIMLILIFLVAIFAIIIYGGSHLESVGKEPAGDRLARILKSPNYKEGSFQNLSNTPVQSEDASFLIIFWNFFFNKVPNLQPTETLPSVKIDLKKNPSNQPTITYFGHSSYLIQIGGKNILMDPVFSERTSPVQFFGTKNFKGTHVYQLSDMPTLDYVFLSHDHYDHMDYETLKTMAGSSIQFVVPLGVGAHLEHWGISPDKIVELDWWENRNIEPGISLTATPARHFSGRGWKRGKSLWASYVLETDSAKIFLGGDSGYEKHFKEIGQKFGPFDLAILECGQYNRWWPYIHMMPEQTAQASLDLNAKVLWPVHWGKFALALHAWNEPIQRISKKAKELDIQLTMPRIGEQIIIGEKYPNDTWW